MIPHDETMMLKTPFHSRVEAACEINMWEDWKGYTSPQAYTEVEQEYFAVRSNTGVFDISPMIKYRFTGPDAFAALYCRQAGHRRPGQGRLSDSLRRT